MYMCVPDSACLCVGWGGRGGDIHRHTGKEPQGSVSMVLLQDVCVHYTCVYLTVHVCVWVGEGGAGDIQAKDLYMYTLFTGSELASSFFLLL